jgi:hypothetical protein
MPNNYVLLEKIVVPTAGASSVTFANIPQTGYTDLVVKMSARDTDSANNWYTLKLQFNSDTTDANYSTRILYGFGSSAGSGTSNRQNTGYITSAARTANTFNNLEMYIPNYTGSSYKSFSTDVVTEGNGSSFEILGLYAGLWSATAAITQVVLAPDAGSFVANSTFYLYGVAKLGTTPTIAPKATGGDVIDTDGTYWYHIFNSSGTFTPAVGLSCDYLVVAGGGGGGYNDGGGGGGGGFRTSIGGSALSLGTSAVTVTVGAGGAGGTSQGVAPSGSDSVFSTITSTGGGGAGGRFGGNSSSGGSGGGAAHTYTAGSGNTPSTSPSQGNNGGAAAGSGTVVAGGGGGASAVGNNGTSSTTGLTTQGRGGAGTASSISGSSVTYAGGGGAGCNSADEPNYQASGGAGGGGTGGKRGTDNATAGTANTGGGGGGGGGGSSANPGKSGGSGIVIVRYLVA